MVLGLAHLLTAHWAQLTRYLANYIFETLPRYHPLATGVILPAVEESA
jgi:hypothetical protein